MSCKFDFSKERLWELSYLRKTCKQMQLEDEYNNYETQIRANYSALYILLHFAFIISHSLLLLTTGEYIRSNYIDIILYFVNAGIVTAVLWVNLYDTFVMEHKWIANVSSIIALSCVVFVDIGTNLLHYYLVNFTTGPFFAAYTMFMIFIFLPFSNTYTALAAGLTMTFAYSIYNLVFIVYTENIHIWETSKTTRIVGEVSHFICLNLIGTFFRFMREIVLRSSVLDRQQYILEDILLRDAREKEKVLLHSILPKQIAEPLQNEIKSRIKFAEKHRNIPIPTKRYCLIAIQIHPEVSILYADMVNYTQLTTTLTVKNLVTLLHDIYARFDQAASKYSVQRIKFLGDCYYCVAGLINPDPNHAKSCIDLGICMIDNIYQVQKERFVDINIRVGVHSGGIFAGVLGSEKLQYDIWGNDVIIANRLEATGKPGHVHISDRAYNAMILHPYKIYPGTQSAREDYYLLKFNIETFLISAIEERFKLSKITHSIDNAISEIKFDETPRVRNKSIKEELREEFKKMPVGPTDLRDTFRGLLSTWIEQKKEIVIPKSPIDDYFLRFRDNRLDYDYIRQPDYMLKYSAMLSWAIGWSLIYVQISFNTNLVPVFFYMDAVLMSGLTLIVIITWYKKFFLWRYSNQFQNYSTINCAFFDLSDYIISSLTIRLFIYLFTLLTLYCFLAIILMDCNRAEFDLSFIEKLLFHYNIETSHCFLPWMLTTMLCLIIATSMVYTRIPFMFKVFVSLLEAVVGIYLVVHKFSFVVNSGFTTNPNLDAKYAHCLLIVAILISLYVKERQTEFNNMMNFTWKMELSKKHHDALITDQSITILLYNILPAHVVDVYLTSLAKDELYYEDYKMVAIMFASLRNFKLDLRSLRVLNEIISEFDRILTYYRNDYLVDKIKIVGCTYMAACGLHIHCTSSGDNGSKMRRVHEEVTRARKSLETSLVNPSEEIVKSNEIVFVLTSFALELMRTLCDLNKEYKSIPADRLLFDASMSVGISSGEAMAGVVGASQVHYDIWGNSVNMASRMDSTGVAGQIQVTEDTAEILRSTGVSNTYRGETFVKGRGLMPTYFVDFTENYEFIHIKQSNLSKVENEKDA